VRTTTFKTPNSSKGHKLLARVSSKKSKVAAESIHIASEITMKSSDLLMTLPRRSSLGQLLK